MKILRRDRGGRQQAVLIFFQVFCCCDLVILSEIFSILDLFFANCILPGTEVLMIIVVILQNHLMKAQHPQAIGPKWYAI